MYKKKDTKKLNLASLCLFANLSIILEESSPVFSSFLFVLNKIKGLACPDFQFYFVFWRLIEGLIVGILAAIFIDAVGAVHRLGLG